MPFGSDDLHPAVDAPFDVVVVGCGPSGSLLTALLARSGCRVLCLDRSTEVYDKPRAIALDHEVLRLFDNLGIAEAVAPHVAPFDISEHRGEEGELLRRIGMTPAPYPLGYTPTMVFTQPPVERILRDHAFGYANVRTALGVDLIDVEQDDTGATLTFRDGPVEERVRASWVIGCDGASSTVRRLCGLGLEDLDFNEPWMVVDLLVKPEALAKLPANSTHYCESSRPSVYVVGPSNHRRWELMLNEDEDPATMREPEMVWRLLKRWIDPSEAELWRAASYRFHALVAREWRSGRVFIAGDAAHQQPPILGQGMCQGMRDAANLAWKLDAVITGAAPDGLLDSYGLERASHARELILRIKAIGKVLCERDPEEAQQRDRRILASTGGVPATTTRQEIIPPLDRGFIAEGAGVAAGSLFPQPRVQNGGRHGLMDKVCGAGWRLVLDARAHTWPRLRLPPAMTLLALVAQEAADGPPNAVTFVEADSILARWFDANTCAAAVVRPDHYVYGVARDEAALFPLLEDLRLALSPDAKSVEGSVSPNAPGGNRRTLSR